jgi:VWFA-related protein
MTRQGAVAALAATALLSSSSLAFQQPSFRSSTLAVRVDVLVTDGRKPVGGLTARDFELRDNGVLQTVDLLDGAGVPINAVLALDTSSSTAGARHADLVAASEALLDGLRPVDRVALTTFSHAVSPRITLTGDVGAVRTELRGIRPTGQTAIMDAAYVAIAATLAQTGRSLVLICTDGYDTWSWLRPADVLESARRSNAVIYAVAAADARQSVALKTLADATGGDVLKVKSSSDLRRAFQRILQDFRSRYVLAYSPSGVPTGGFHTLDVRVRQRGLTVKARPGYTGVGPAK